jgi:serine/threonine-protein kinase
VCPRCGALQPTQLRTIGPQTEIDLGTARLVIDARLGEGGMGIVWRGWMFHAPGTPRALEPAQPVAIKVLPPRMRGNLEIRALFLHEADALRVLAHPNVVGLIGHFERGEDLAIVMEYVDGDTLDAVVARHVARARLAGPGGLVCMPFLRAWYYFQQLLGALAAVHALGFVHRDVKPSNVLVRRDGVVKLGDFGIAQLARLQPTPQPAPVLPTYPPSDGGLFALAAGTGAYMSPEQVLSHPLDGRSDLYAAAVVLYEMLAGRTPFLSEQRGEFLVRHDQVTAEPPPIRQFVPQAPPVLDTLFARALAKDRTQRFANAIEMGDAFRSALGIADSPEWRAQAELSNLARVAVLGPTAPAERKSDPVRKERIATLRDFLVDRYRTAKMQAR